MNFERFSKLLKEAGFAKDSTIAEMWAERPRTLDEDIATYGIDHVENSIRLAAMAVLLQNPQLLQP